METRSLKPTPLWSAAVVVAAVTVVCFSPSLQNGFVNWDDPGNFLNNENYRGLSLDHIKWMFTDRQGHYIPIAWLTLGLDYVIWEMNPRGYHLTSLLFHVFNALLFFFLTAGILRKAAGSNGAVPVAAAAAGALFFAIHPLRVESVVWITERRDVVAGFFVLLTLIAYLRMQERPRGSRPYFRWLAVSLVCFACSLLSKAFGMTLPALLLVLDAYPLRRLSRETIRPVLIEKIPYALLSVGAVLLVLSAQQEVGAMQTGYPLMSTLMQPAFRVCFHIWKTVAPVALSPLYLYKSTDVLADPIYTLCAVAAVGVTVGLWRLRRRWPAAAAAWFGYLILIAPMLGIPQIGPHHAADRNTYLACMPFAVLFAALLTRRRGAAAIGLSALALLTALGALSYRQTRVWKNSMTLWNHALSIDPDNYFAYYQRGRAWEEQEDYHRAVADYAEAHERNPGHLDYLRSLINMRLRTEDFRGALEFLEPAIEIWPDECAYQSAVGWCLYKKTPSEAERAHEHIEIAARIDPDDGINLFRLSVVLRALGKDEAAEEARLRAQGLGAS